MTPINRRAEARLAWTGLSCALLVSTVVVSIPKDVLAAGLLDGTVSITNYSPNLSTIYAGPVAGATTSTINLVGYSFSFADDSITFVNPYCCTWGSPPPVAFGGFVLSFSGVPQIAGVTNDASSEVTPAQLYTISNEVFIGFTAGAARYAGQTGVFDVQFASAAPEPGSWAMLLVGFAGLGVTLRAQRSGRTALSALTIRLNGRQATVSQRGT